MKCLIDYFSFCFPCSEKTFVELSLQDFYSTKSMEKELLQEREWVTRYHILSVIHITASCNMYISFNGCIYMYM